MNVTRTLEILALLLVLTGLVFVGQGLGLLRGRSVMVDDLRWALIGGVMVVAGVGVWIRSRSARR